LLAIGWVVATLSSVIGLYAAYKMDLPTGAAIVCVLGLALILAAAIAKFKKQTNDEPAAQT
jgi:ABC-type Mn2+/Zn2+ transport system permease subunit